MKTNNRQPILWALCLLALFVPSNYAADIQSTHLHIVDFKKADFNSALPSAVTKLPEASFSVKYTLDCNVPTLFASPQFADCSKPTDGSKPTDCPQPTDLQGLFDQKNTGGIQQFSDFRCAALKFVENTQNRLKRLAELAQECRENYSDCSPKRNLTREELRQMSIKREYLENTLQDIYEKTLNASFPLPYHNTIGPAFGPKEIEEAAMQFTKLEGKPVNYTNTILGKIHLNGTSVKPSRADLKFTDSTQKNFANVFEGMRIANLTYPFTTTQTCFVTVNSHCGFANSASFEPIQGDAIPRNASTHCQEDISVSKAAEAIMRRMVEKYYKDASQTVKKLQEFRKSINETLDTLKTEMTNYNERTWVPEEAQVVNVIGTAMRGGADNAYEIDFTKEKNGCRNMANRKLQIIYASASASNKTGSFQVVTSADAKDTEPEVKPITNTGNNQVHTIKFKSNECVKKISVSANDGSILRICRWADFPANYEGKDFQNSACALSAEPRLGSSESTGSTPTQNPAPATPTPTSSASRAYGLGAVAMTMFVGSLIVL